MSEREEIENSLREFEGWCDWYNDRAGFPTKDRGDHTQRVIDAARKYAASLSLEVKVELFVVIRYFPDGSYIFAGVRDSYEEAADAIYSMPRTLDQRDALYILPISETITVPPIPE